MNTQDDVIKIFNQAEALPYADTSLQLHEIIELLPKKYYCNAAKHVGAILSRMVNNGKLIRVKKGTFKINPNPTPRSRVEISVDPNQYMIRMES